MHFIVYYDLISKRQIFWGTTLFLKDQWIKRTMFFMYYKEPSLIIIIIITRPMFWMVCHPSVIAGIIAQKVLYDWLTYLNFNEILLYMDACMDLFLKHVESWNNHVSLFTKKFPPYLSVRINFSSELPPAQIISQYILTWCHSLYFPLKQSYCVDWSWKIISMSTPPHNLFVHKIN